MPHKKQDVVKHSGTRQRLQAFPRSFWSKVDIWSRVSKEGLALITVFKKVNAMQLCFSELHCSYQLVTVEIQHFTQVLKTVNLLARDSRDPIIFFCTVNEIVTDKVMVKNVYQNKISQYTKWEQR